jgi:CDP-4-dehydro-6-deoxyglucose reductase
MITETLARPAETGEVRLFWGMRDEGELYWLDRLEALASSSPRFHHTLCLSRPAAGWAGARGRINAHVIEALPALERPTFYLVGNGDMVKELKGLLVGAGVDRKRQIRTEVFYPETKAA